jgi:hypothetical protein
MTILRYCGYYGSCGGPSYSDPMILIPVAIIAVFMLLMAGSIGGPPEGRGY